MLCKIKFYLVFYHIYVIGKLLYTFIYEKHYFTEAWLNSKLRELDFGDESNIPPEIKGNRLKLRMNVKMSAAEMLVLVKYLGILVGEKIPHGDIHWELYKVLRQIIDILMSPRVDAGLLRDLRDLIEQLLTSYSYFYGTLQPKFHLLLHYARLMAWMGPCKKFWCMNFESRHRNLKCNAQSTSSNKNLLQTIAIKQVLRMCQMIHTFRTENSTIFGPILSKDSEVCYQFVKINGIEYRPGHFVVTNMNGLQKEFGKIIKIKVLNDEVIFTIESYEEIQFDSHYHVYRVSHKPEKDRDINHEYLPLIMQVNSIETSIKNEYWHCIIPRYIL